MKIAIITFNQAINYGALLQTIALEKSIAIKSNKNEVYILDYNNVEMGKCYSIKNRLLSKSSIKRSIAQIYLTFFFIKKKKSFIKIGKSLAFLPFSQKDQCDILVTGSDQVFNIGIAKKDETYFLPSSIFSTQKKYSYAASFGKIENYLSDQSKINEYLSSFSMISVREKSMLPILKKQFNNVRYDIDPTLLFDSHFWNDYCSSKNKIKEPYLLIYTISKPKGLVNFAKKIATKKNLDIIQIDGSILKRNGIKTKRGVSPSDFLSLIKNAEYVCTTSFHGTAFSIIYNKKFFVEIGKGKNKNERIENLLDLLNLRERNIDLLKDNFLDEEINYLEVEGILIKERKRSFKYISEIVNQGDEL